MKRSSIPIPLTLGAIDDERLMAGMHGPFSMYLMLMSYIWKSPDNPTSKRFPRLGEYYSSGLLVAYLTDKTIMNRCGAKSRTTMFNWRNKMFENRKAIPHYPNKRSMIYILGVWSQNVDESWTATYLWEIDDDLYDKLVETYHNPPEYHPPSGEDDVPVPPVEEKTSVQKNEPSDEETSVQENEPSSVQNIEASSVQKSERENALIESSIESIDSPEENPWDPSNLEDLPDTNSFEEVPDYGEEITYGDPEDPHGDFDKNKLTKNTKPRTAFERRFLSVVGKKRFSPTELTVYERHVATRPEEYVEGHMEWARSKNSGKVVLEIDFTNLVNSIHKEANWIKWQRRHNG